MSDDARAIPILPCRQLDATLAFYGLLGFTLEFEENEPAPYAILTLGGAELHFAGIADPARAGLHGACYLRVPDADALHAHGRAAGVPDEGLPRLGPIDDRPWGMREFALVDPDGNMLRVGHLVD